MKIKKILSGFIAATMIMSSISVTAFAEETTTTANWSDSADASWYNETDTSFTIDTAAELAGLASILNAETDTFKDKTITLGADIDLENKEWTPIGNHTTVFMGTFDGADYTISNLYINASEGRKGLFGCAGGETIKNLTINNAEVNSTGAHIAVLVGHGDHEGGHVLENIKITGLVKVKALCNAGTIMGSAPNVNLTASGITVDVEDGSFVDTTLNITPENPAGKYYSYTGGVFGQVWGKSFDNITSNIDVVGACVGTGGITGGATGTWSNITHTGDVIIAGEKDMGYWYTNKDENGNSYGQIFWWQGAGTISGYHGGTTFTKCVSTGTLKYQADNTTSNEIYYNANLVKANTSEVIEIVTLCDSRFGSSRWNNDNTITVNDYVEVDEEGEVVAPVVAIIGETGYSTVNDAIKAAAAGNTITLIADVVEKDIKVEADDNVIIDLNGHILYGDIISGGTLTVKNGEIKGTRFVSAIESNGANADLTIENVKVISYRHALRIEGGNAEIISGTYTTLGKVGGESTTHAVNAGGVYTTTVTVKDGTFIGIKGSQNTDSADSGAAVYAQNNATVTISGGNFGYGQNDTLAVLGTGSISASGGTFDQDPSVYVAEGYHATKNDDGTFTIEEIPAPVPGVTFTDEGASVSFEDYLFINQYFTVSGVDEAYMTANGGILSWTGSDADPAVMIESEKANISTLKYGESGFSGRTMGIFPNLYMDKIYVCPFVKLEDGGYVFGDVKAYTLEAQCMAALGANISDKEKAAFNALLDYCKAVKEYVANKK